MFNFSLTFDFFLEAAAAPQIVMCRWRWRWRCRCVISWHDKKVHPSWWCSFLTEWPACVFIHAVAHLDILVFSVSSCTEEETLFVLPRYFVICRNSCRIYPEPLRLGTKVHQGTWGKTSKLHTDMTHVWSWNQTHTFLLLWGRSAVTEKNVEFVKLM